MRVCAYNLENLFVSMAYYQGENLERITEDGWRSFALAQIRRRQKPLAKVFGVARALLDIAPDVALLTEVGGRDSLENFARHFLDGRYDAHFVEGNSSRGIDLGFLVRRGLPFRAETVSNRELPIDVATLQGHHEARFSRDLAELRLSDESGVKLIFVLAHLKSKLSTEGDFQGKDQRTAEAMALASHYENLRLRHPETPIVVGGDFNAELGSLELELLRHTDLSDFQDLIGTPQELRATLIHFESASRPRPLVFDHLLVSPQLKDRVLAEGSGVYRYKTFHGIADELPTTQAMRFRLPSDHYPVVLNLNL